MSETKYYNNNGCHIKYQVLDTNEIYVEHIYVEEDKRGQHLPIKSFNFLFKKYPKSKVLFLLCWPDLVNYYRHIGFQCSQTEVNNNDLNEMMFVKKSI